MAIPAQCGEHEGEGEGEGEITNFLVEHVEYPECQLGTPMINMSLSSLHTHTCTHIHVVHTHTHVRTHAHIPDDALNPLVLIVQVDHLCVRLPGRPKDTHV